jgi:hypothetical protein
MRARFIRPGFFINERLGKLHPLTRILFAGLWCLADRDGKLEDRPAWIKVQVLPYDQHDINGELTVLEKEGFIRRYGVGNNRYISVLRFSQNQSPHHTEKESEIPDLPLESEGLLGDSDNNGYLTSDSFDELLSVISNQQRRISRRKEEGTGEDGFNAFWESYPKRNGKKSGKKQALEQWRRLTGEEKREAETAISKQIEHRSRCLVAGVFCPEFPDAFRWLRDRKFEDEVSELPKPMDEAEKRRAWAREEDRKAGRV